MKLPLLEHLQVRKFPQEFKPKHSKTFNVSQDAKPAEGFEKHNRYYRTTVEIGYSQVAPTQIPPRHIRERGTKFIMREVYGPVVDELITLTKELHELGLSSQDQPMKHIYDIIDKLEGNQ